MVDSRSLLKTSSLTVFSALLLSLSPSAKATTVLRLNVDRLLGESALVVEGTVVRVGNDEGDHERIPTTLYEICNLTEIEGTHEADCLSLKVPGGQRGEGYAGYSGMPQLKEGERYIFFLTHEQTWRSPFVGWWQGLYRVVETDKGAVILSNEGQPVSHIDAAGFILTHRAVETIETPLGTAEHTSSGHHVSAVKTSAAPAMQRALFIDTVHAAVNKRAQQGLRNPTRLPASWSCYDSVSTPATEPPPVLPWQEVTR